MTTVSDRGIAGASDPLLICVPSAVERRLLPSSVPGLRILQCGIGEAAGRHAAVQVRTGARGLVSFGFAAAIAPGVASGTLLLPRRLLTAGGEHLNVTAEWRDRVAARLGPVSPVADDDLLQSREVISTAERKRALHAVTGALAVDMESAPLVNVAARAGIPVLALRAVLDTADDDVPSAIVAILGPQGHLQIRPLLAALIRTPGSLVRLARGYRTASRRLAKAARCALPELLHPDDALRS